MSLWTGAEDLVPTGIRSPNRPARKHIQAHIYRIRTGCHRYDTIFIYFRLFNLSPLFQEQKYGVKKDWLLLFGFKLNMDGREN